MLDQIDTRTEAGRTGYRLKVQEAKRIRGDARNVLGSSREGPPNLLAIVRAAHYLQELLNDATSGELELLVQDEDGDVREVGVVLAVLSAQRRAGN